MHEPFHLYHARRQLERDTIIPTLDAPAATVRLHRRQHSPSASASALMRILATVTMLLIERFSA